MKYTEFHDGLMSFQLSDLQLRLVALVMCSVSINGKLASLANLKLTIGLLECS